MTHILAITHPFEFNFRDDNQFWGFEDFMNVQPMPVASARSRGQLSLYGRGRKRYQQPKKAPMSGLS